MTLSRIRACRACQIAKVAENRRRTFRVYRTKACCAVQHRLDLIPSGKAQADQVRCGGKLSVSQAVERILEIMRKTGDVVEAEHRARAFNRVEGAECPAHYFTVAPILVQLQQRGFQFHQQFAGFFLESQLVFVNHRIRALIPVVRVQGELIRLPS